MAKRPGLGLTLPVQDGTVGYFNIAYDALTQTKSNLTNLLLTRKGERVMQPTFGCDIQNLVFEEITDDLVATAQGSIQEAAQIWLPFITINNVVIQKDEDNNRVYVAVTFSLKTAANITATITVGL
jgi:uncharacterized protein